MRAPIPTYKTILYIFLHLAKHYSENLDHPIILSLMNRYLCGPNCKLGHISVAFTNVHAQYVPMTFSL